MTRPHRREILSCTLTAERGEKNTTQKETADRERDSGAEAKKERIAQRTPARNCDSTFFRSHFPFPHRRAPRRHFSLRSRCEAVIFYSFICRLSTAHVTFRPRPSLYQPQQSPNQYSKRRYQRYHRSETRFNEEGVNKITSSLIPKERFHKYTVPAT